MWLCVEYRRVQAGGHGQRCPRIGRTNWTNGIVVVYLEYGQGLQCCWLEVLELGISGDICTVSEEIGKICDLQSCFTGPHQTSLILPDDWSLSDVLVPRFFAFTAPLFSSNCCHLSLTMPEFLLKIQEYIMDCLLAGWLAELTVTLRP